MRRLGFLGRLRARLGNESGATMMEAVTVTVSIAILSVFIGQVLNTGTEASNFAAENDANLSKGRLVFYQMGRAVRAIKDNSSISSASSDAISFENVDGETVSYQFEDGVLYLNGEQLYDGIKDLELTYQDENEATISSPGSNLTKIRTIRISVETMIDDRSSTLSTTVFPRNLQL